MHPASPVIKGHEEVVYAKDQPEYLPLPAIRQSDGCIVTRWQMTWRERIKALLTGSVYLEVLTFNQRLQPVKISVDVPEIEGNRQPQHGPRAWATALVNTLSLSRARQRKA